MQQQTLESSDNAVNAKTHLAVEKHIYTFLENTVNCFLDN